VPRYKSKFPGYVQPSYSTFGLSGTSKPGVIKIINEFLKNIINFVENLKDKQRKWNASIAITWL
jgi:hypothetical protein